MTPAAARYNRKEQRRILTAFDRALQREQHVLSQWPDSLWQQIHNRLQWESKDVRAQLKKDFESRTRPGCSPWLHMQNPYRESDAFIRFFVGHKDIVTCLAVSPDGRFLVSGSKDRTVRIWDLESGLRKAVLEGHEDEVNSCTFSPNGQVVVSGSEDATLRLWDAQSGNELAVLKQSDPVTCLALSPDGRSLASTGEEQIIRLWNRETGSSKEIPTNLFYRAKRCVYLPDGSTLALSDEGHALYAWDMQHHEMRTLLEMDQNVGAQRLPISIFAFSPDGSKVVVAHDLQDRMLIFDLATHDVIHILECGSELYTNPANTITYSPDGRWICAAGHNNILYFWDAATGALIGALEGHENAVMDVAFTPDNDYVLSGSADHTIRMWDLRKALVPAVQGGHYRPITQCCYSHNGKSILSTSNDSVLRVWDAETLEETRSIFQLDPRHDADAFMETTDLNDCAFSPDGNPWPGGGSILRAGNDCNLALFEEDDGWSEEMEGHNKPVLGCSYAPDGRLLASGGEDLTVRIWDRYWFELLHTLEGHTGYVTACPFSPDGLTVASSSWDKTLRIWDPAAGKLLRTLEGHTGPVLTCAFAPDGRTLASAGVDGTLRIWDPAGSKLLHIIDGYTAQPLDCTFSPDGQFLVSVHRDRALNLWAASSGEKVYSMVLPGSIQRIGLHPWKTELIAGDTGGSLYKLEMHGIMYHTMILTAHEGDQGLKVVCPACQQSLPVPEAQLGQDIICPHADCGLPIKLNPFSIGPLFEGVSMMQQ